jgi:cell division protein FtsB
VQAPAGDEGTRPGWQLGLRFTRRALVLALVLVVLAISYAGSLRIYIAGAQDLAVAEQAIRDRQAQIADLQAELARWDDPAYVKTQARERLGWVLPGETGYRVVDDNGNPLGGGVVLSPGDRTDPDAANQHWWDRMLGSLATADHPVRKLGP